MLKEQEDTLTDKSQWKKVKHMFHKDSRYKSIDSSSKREEMFNEYIKSLNRVIKLHVHVRVHLSTCKYIYECTMYGCG